MRTFLPTWLSCGAWILLVVALAGCSGKAPAGLVGGLDAGKAGAGDGGGGRDATQGDSGLGFADGAAGGDASACDNPLDRQGCSCPAGSAPRTCYTGPASQAGIGACTMGQQTCNGQGEIGGTWGPCTGSGRPTTCAAASSQCGTNSDGCGGVLNCGTCPAGQSCSSGPGGTGNVCSSTACVVTATCASLGDTCGSVPDNCGNTLNCGMCSAGQTCGGFGVPNQCGCTPATCAALGDNCGSVSDGCGGTLECGRCPNGQHCGAGGVANQCGCFPKTCADLGDNCGSASDGCGGTLDCGTCPANQTCGAGGIPNFCGMGPCIPTTCAALGDNCGSVPDGCGNMLDCGACPGGQSCGAGGTPNQCACNPTTCAALGDNCGSVPDGCGGTLSCGTCANGQTCGGAGVPNQCACTPTTCAALGDNCGSVPDGCGGTLSCGTCANGQMCGGAGVANQCGGCSTGCCASNAVAFVNCGTAGVMKPGAFNVQTVACSAVQTATALQAYDTIVYVGPMSPAANADFPPAITTALNAGAKVIFIPTGTCDGAGCTNFGLTNWQTIYSDLYLEDNEEFPESIAAATISVPNSDAMATAFSSATYGSYQLSHLMFDGSVATIFEDYPGGTLSGTFAWCSDLVAASADGTRSTPFHGYLLDSGTRKGLLIVTTLDYVLAGNTIDFSEPFLAAHLSLPWNRNGNSAACGLSCSTTKPWIPVIGMEKPVIYLYPTKDEDVYVRLDLNGQFVRTYPEYDQGIHGWKVHARHDGELRDLRDGQEYSYLYWSGESAAFKPSFDEGFVVEGKSTRKFLQTTLAKMGLTPREYNDMIVYWLPYMENSPYNLVSFVGTAYTDVAKLTITPKPDSMLRVFMIFKKLEAPVSVKPQVLEPFKRKGFTVVEWGGTEIGGDRHVIQ